MEKVSTNTGIVTSIFRKRFSCQDFLKMINSDLSFPLKRQYEGHHFSKGMESYLCVKYNSENEGLNLESISLQEIWVSGSELQK